MKKIILTCMIPFLLVSCFMFPDNDTASGSFTLEAELNDLQAVQASLEYSTSDGQIRTALVALSKNQTVFNSGRITLKNGDYNLTRCIFMDSEDNIIAAAPISGSEKAAQVSESLPLEFTISKDESLILSPECIEYAVDDDPGNYGYEAARINVLSRYDDFAHSINGFTFDLMHELSENGKNSFVSPVSIMYAFGLLHPGSGSYTTDELNNVFNFTDYEREELYQLYKDFGDYLIHLDEGVELSLAHAVWYAQGKTLKNTYLSALQTYFNASVNACNFGNADSCADVINLWASDNTHERITNVVQPSNFATETRAVLANATYFKGLWLSEFSKNDTKEEYFYISTDGSDSILCDMMHGGSDEDPMAAGYIFDNENNCMIASLPFKNNSCYEMICLMPLSGSLGDLIQNIDSELWNTWCTNTTMIEAIVTMPKFTQHFKYKLKDDLSSLGMTSLFGNADLSGMFEINENLYVSDVFHDTFIEVKEEGAEAAAVTVIPVYNTVAGPKTPVHITLDHPFIYAIQDAQTHAIVFIGEMMDPNSEGK